MCSYGHVETNTKKQKTLIRACFWVDLFINRFTDKHDASIMLKTLGCSNN